MPADRLALYTTVYPAVAKFLPVWYRSVRAQTDQDFDLWLGVDAMTEDELDRALGARVDARRVFAPPGSSSSEVRAMAIERLVAGYDAIVFADSDDILHPERVSAARRALGRYDVAACALKIVDEAGHDLGLVFGPAPGEDPVEMLPRYNVFGLSNSAYRAELLRRCLPLQPENPLVDWVIATRAWGLGAAMYFDPTPLMKYRQYGTNIARVLPPFSSEDVRAATERVLTHYESMLGGSPALPDAQRAALCEAWHRARSFHQLLAASDERSERYVSALNALPPRYVWWWCIANPELEEVWRS